MQETKLDSWVGKIRWRRDRLPTPVFWPGEFHGLYSPWVARSRTRLSDFPLTPFHPLCRVCWVAQLYLTLWDPMDCSPPGSSVRGVFQSRILEWVIISFCRGSLRPRDWTHIFCIGRWILYHWATWEAPCLVAQSCPTLCDPVDCSLPGCSVHGILQARILQWVARPSSTGKP